MNRCRYCGIHGHNIVTCPKMKEKAITNPNSWAAEKAASYKKTKEEGGKARTCSYCSETGHNKKTCKKIIENVSEAINVNYKFRRAAITYYQKHGIGPGALLQFDRVSGYNNSQEWKPFEKALGLVLSVKKENLVYPGVRVGDIEVEFMNVYQYNGVSLARTELTIPNSFIVEDRPISTNDPYDSEYYYSTPVFSVLSRGYFQVDNEEQFCKDGTPFHDMSRYGNNYNFHYTFNNRKFFK